MRKPVFGVCNQVRHKLACSATETTYSLEISAIVRRDIILSRQRTTKVLIRLRGCAGWSAPLLFAYGINRFSHDVALLFSYTDLFCYKIPPKINSLCNRFQYIITVFWFPLIQFCVCCNSQRWPSACSLKDKLLFIITTEL